MPSSGRFLCLGEQRQKGGGGKCARIKKEMEKHSSAHLELEHTSIAEQISPVRSWVHSRSPTYSSHPSSMDRVIYHAGGNEWHGLTCPIAPVSTGLFTASVTFDTPLSLARMDRSRNPLSMWKMKLLDFFLGIIVLCTWTDEFRTGGKR